MCVRAHVGGWTPDFFVPSTAGKMKHKTLSGSILLFHEKLKNACPELPDAQGGYMTGGLRQQVRSLPYIHLHFFFARQRDRSYIYIRRYLVDGAHSLPLQLR